MRKFWIIGILITLSGLAFIRAQDLTNLKDQKPVRFTGSTELRGIFYNANGIPNRRAPFTWLLSGNPTLSLYGWDIPISFVLSKDDRSFQQPFNQYGLSPTYKWLTIHAGYRNVSFSPYTLGGHTMLGGGIEARPGKWRMGLMYGRLNRATVIDTTRQALVPFSFSRKGLAGKLGFGTERTFFDISILRAIDDPNSAPENASLLPIELRSMPAANTVLGFGTRVTFLKKFVFESDGAASIYTYDINSPFDIEQFVSEKYRWLLPMFNINASTEWAIAANGAIGYQDKNFGLKLGYRRIDPGFLFMGAYYIANDLENWTINPNFILLNNKIRFNGSLGLQRDNLYEQKQSKSKRIIGSAVLSTEITKELGLDLNFSNYSNTLQPKALVFADSMKIVQTTNTFTIMPRYTIQNENSPQMIFLMANFNNMKDYNGYYSADARSRDIKTQQFSLNYNISFPKNKLSFFSGLNYTNMISDIVKNNYAGITLGGSYAFFENKMTTGISSSFMRNKTSNSASNIINGSLNASYALSKMHSLRGMVFITNNKSKVSATGGYPSFRETRAELSYQFKW